MDFVWAIYVFFLRPLLTLVLWMTVIYVVLGWLMVFNVVNPRNQFVATIARFAGAIVEPILRPFRAVVPPINQVDLSPVLMILTLFFTRDWLLPTLLRSIAGAPTSIS